MAFQVWAPLAQRVELSTVGRRLEMERDGEWWRLSLDTPPEVEYAFFVDGHGPFPDPRSRWQPHGVHGPSRALDVDFFGWRHDEWPQTPLSQAVIYELHIGTFTPSGTFDSAIDKLDHLVDLGATHVEVMPVAHFSGERGWGYDGVDLFAPHEAYGGPAGFMRFVDACHGKGLRVILDVVYNHLGPSGNYLERFGPYFTERYHTPWGKAINYDQAYSDEVRRFVVDNALMWLRDYRVDGLRLDAVHAILDESAVHILEQLSRETAKLETETGRRLDLIAESDLNDPRLVQDPKHGGYGLGAAWSDDFHHALHALLSGERTGYYEDFGSLGQLAEALQRVYVFDGRYSRYRRRTHGRPIGDLPATRFVFATQNHDQVGNRAQGERLVHLVGIRRAKIAAALLLLSPAVPLLFQGEEWAASSPFLYFTAHEDAALGEAVSSGRRREFAAFGWQPVDVPDPQDYQTFARSQVDWAELERPEHHDMLDWYRSLIALRRSTPSLTNGDLREVFVHFSEAEGWLTLEKDPLALAVNFSGVVRVISVRPALRLTLSSDPAASLQGRELHLPADSAVILASGSMRRPADTGE